MYLVYFPNETRKTKEVYEERGLGDLHHKGESDPVFAVVDGPGPDGEVGGMMSCPVPLKHATELMIMYLPDRQTWFHNKKDDHWIGWVEPPTMEQLLRPDHIDGLPVMMADGSTWGIPNLWERQHVMSVNEDGEQVTKERWKHEALYRTTLDVVEMVKHRLYTEYEVKDEKLKDEHAWDDGKAFEFLCRVLPLNYRVTRFIIGQLGIIESDKLVSLVSAATDIEGLMRMQAELLSGELSAPS